VINQELAMVNHEYTDRFTPSFGQGAPVVDTADKGLAWAHSFVGPDHVGIFWIRDDPPAFGTYSPAA